MRLRQVVAALAVAMLACTAAQAEPTKIRIAWVVTPAALTPIMFKPPGVAQHLGKSYVVEDVHIGASSQQITAIAANQIDIAALNYSSFPLAVLNGQLDDLRIIAVYLRQMQIADHARTAGTPRRGRGRCEVRRLFDQADQAVTAPRHVDERPWRGSGPRAG